ncbi:MAG: hypothetical protein NC417_04270 [Candidatus Gastranaerophilales bacterium]|nr:hypothetical protein [Candidatus Gastranaerophilales bacterium]
MKQRVRKQGKKLLGLALAAAFMLVQPVATVQAAAADETEDDVEQLETTVYELSEEELAGIPSAYTMLSGCSIVVGCDERGLIVDITTGATQTASLLGIKDIVVEQQKWYGWKPVATAPGVEIQNRAGVGVSFIYTGAVYGETYRISCVHYGTVDSYTEEEHVTPGIVYKY